MYSHNYKNLPYKKSVQQFLKDYRLRYFLYGRFMKWKTKEGKKITISKLRKNHLKNIVAMFGNTKIRNEHPFVWYKYLLKDGDD
jgi:hypothetical protein